jgi:hypothetical protein
MPDSVHSLQCPECGAPLKIQEGQSRLECPYCYNSIEIAPERAPAKSPARRARKKIEVEDDRPVEDPFIEYIGVLANSAIDVANPDILWEKDKAAHAWGKGQAGGSAAAPAAFESVTTLGPVTLACIPHKKHLSLHLGTPHISALVVYRDGFAFQKGGKDATAWRFDEVAAIRIHEENITHNSHKREYTLIHQGGEAVVLDSSPMTWASEDDALQLADLMQAASFQIRLALYRRLLPALLKRYEADEELAFGPVCVQQGGGITVNGHHYAWKEVEAVEVKWGKFQVIREGGKKTEVRIPEIPNVELLGRLIGVDQAEMNMNLEFIG